MVLKTLYKKLPQNDVFGFTIVELLVVISVTMLLFTALIIMVNPAELLKRNRDNTRISDLSVLDRVISEYKVDYGVYPDSQNTLRISTVLPTGSLDLPRAAAGWIAENLSRYTTKLPLDPINNDLYNYKYTHNGETYELNARMEISFDQSQADGGTDSFVYELGNNLTLIN